MVWNESPEERDDRSHQLYERLGLRDSTATFAGDRRGTHRHSGWRAVHPEGTMNTQLKPQEKKRRKANLE